MIELAQKIEIKKLPENAFILLRDKFRRQLIEEAIKKAGSMRQLGIVMGYTSNAPNWSIKQILRGNQGIPLFRLKRLCDFMKISFEAIERNIKEIKK